MKDAANIHTIWSSDIDLNEWKDAIEEEVKPRYPEADGLDIDTFIDKFYSECYDYVADLNNDYLDDEKANLDIETEGDIICISDIGRWNGRSDGYGYEGNNINEIFHSHVRGQSDITFFVELYNGVLDLKADEVHHDGTNHYLYRELKPDLTDEQREEFEGLIYDGKCEYPDIEKYTRPLGQEVQKIYGFELKEEKAIKQQSAER